MLDVFFLTIHGPEEAFRYLINDEYGPYIYQFSAAGYRIQTIWPLSISGKLKFITEVNPGGEEQVKS